VRARVAWPALVRGPPASSPLDGVGVGFSGFGRELSAVFYTLYEAACYVGLARTAPLIAALLLVVLIAGFVLLILSGLSIAAGYPLKLNAFRSPRSLAGLAVVAGYFVWNRFASPGGISFIRADYSDEPGKDRTRRRLRVTLYVMTLAASLWVLT
jgi:hypothetical protein